MSARSLQRLREMYPGRYALRAEEVALVLRGKNTRRVVERQREKMADGRHPGARKIDGTWQLPLDDLAEILEPASVATPVLPAGHSAAAPSRTGRRRSEIGPRLGFIHDALFWSQVFRALGFVDEARELDEQAQAMRDEGNQVRALERARERRARLTDLANAGGRVIPDAPPKDGGL
ncbi:hypothetical protein [Pseudoxanthomonas koreensis]|uniref:hypothetical protein n=1 Tax=Pseudoxanthomonas koreensis TaxID=266061 RepID=UPI001EE49AF8|nr:hypothetical protein [Pseudoxanthomonas koreensis]